MRLGNKLALVLALAGTVTIIISEILATCVSVGLLAAGNAGSNCDTWQGPVNIGIWFMLGIFLLGFSAILGLAYWNPKPNLPKPGSAVSDQGSAAGFDVLPEFRVPLWFFLEWAVGGHLLGTS